MRLRKRFPKFAERRRRRAFLLYAQVCSSAATSTRMIDMPDPDSVEDLTQKEARAKAEAAFVRAQADLVKAQGELAAANKPPALDPNDDLKQQEARAKSEATQLRAQADLIKAQSEPAAAKKPPDQAVVADTAEKERLDARKGTLEARKALSDMQKQADLSAAQAAIGTVAGSNIEGSVTVKQEGGKGEATLLASVAVVTAAVWIDKALGKKLDGKRVVMMQGGKAPQFANYRQFLMQQNLLSRLFDKSTGAMEAGRLEQEAKRLAAPSAPRPAELESAAIPVVTVAGVAIDAIAKLGSYFMSNYEIGDIAVAADVEELVSAVAGRILERNIEVILPGRRIPQVSDFSDAIQKVVDNVAAADKTALRLDDEAKLATALSQADAARSARLQQAAKLYDQGATLLRNVIAKADEFIAGLGAADAKGVLLITKLAEEQSICNELAKDNALVLVLNLRVAVGGYYTKKNLWTFLGGMPFFAMGGAIATYALVDKDGKLVASGLIPVHSGYEAVNKVPVLVNGSPGGGK